MSQDACYRHRHWHIEPFITDFSGPLPGHRLDLLVELDDLFKRPPPLAPFAGRGKGGSGVRSLGGAAGGAVAGVSTTGSGTVRDSSHFFTLPAVSAPGSSVAPGVIAALEERAPLEKYKDGVWTETGFTRRF